MSDHIETRGHDTTVPQFRTICCIGYWLHVDAMWNTGTREGGLTAVHFKLVDGYSDEG